MIVRCWQPYQDAELTLSPVPTGRPLALMHTRCPCTCLSASLGNPARFGGPDAGAHVASGPWSSGPWSGGLWSGAKINSREEDRECGPLVSPKVDRLPPKDYRTDRAWLSMVENQHFPPDVENLVKPLPHRPLARPLRTPCMATPTCARALATLERLTGEKRPINPKGPTTRSTATPPCHPVRA